ncbi:transposase [Gammaproteobacteria bacterium 42_54_T18]|nr:transposase [Gammaproteobacteria bacterium 42_54_T18]
MSDFLKPTSKPAITLRKTNIAKRFKEGRGKGVGKFYKPFLEVRDVPSKGRCHRLPSITHGRVVHLLSDLELAIFYQLDWDVSIFDIREQFPLNPQDTKGLAEEYDIPHPEYQGVKQVMTTDFLVDRMVDGKTIKIALSGKYASDLDDPRTIEKQELERRYWHSKGVDWHIVTEKEIPATLVRNIRWLLPHFHSFDLSEQDRRLVFEQFTYAFGTYPPAKIAQISALLDQANEEEPGTYLSWLRHLLAQRAFIWDMGVLPHSKLTSEDLVVSDNWQHGEMLYVSSQ